MAELRMLNEFGMESCVIALEPSRKCVASCTYCFSQLARRKPWANRQIRWNEDPGTFESTLNKAFSVDYDPSDFLQYALRERFPIGYANTVEPFQDVAQARSILETSNQFDIPFFFQTKGINFDEVWPDLEPFHDNSVLFVSFPTPNDKALKRFEPGTPLAAHRWHVIEKSVQAGFYVILALSPYHEDWCDDPAGFIADAAKSGVRQVFYDRLYLNTRNRKAAVDKVTIELAGSSGKRWSEKAIDHIEKLYESTLTLGLDWTCNGTHSLGAFPTIEGLCPSEAFQRGGFWPYFDAAFLNRADALIDESQDSGPLGITWDTALSLMEFNGKITQPFRWSSLSDLMTFKKLARPWRRVIGEFSPISTYLRAVWNSPNLHHFGWWHPFVRPAVDPDGVFHRDDFGNIIMIHDYKNNDKCSVQLIDDIDNLDFLELESSDAA